MELNECPASVQQDRRLALRPGGMWQRKPPLNALAGRNRPGIARREPALDYMAVLEKRLHEADEGRTFWNGLAEELKLGCDDMVLALLGRDEECAGIVLDYGRYLKKLKGYKNIYAISDSEMLLDKAGKKAWITGCRGCSGERMKQLELLYHLYKFSRQLIWGTLRDIEDADGTRLSGVNGISLEEIVVTAVLDLPFDECREQRTGRRGA